MWRLNHGTKTMSMPLLCQPLTLKETSMILFCLWCFKKSFDDNINLFLPSSQSSPSLTYSTHFPYKLMPKIPSVQALMVFPGPWTGPPQAFVLLPASCPGLQLAGWPCRPIIPWHKAFEDLLRANAWSSWSPSSNLVDKVLERSLSRD